MTPDDYSQRTVPEIIDVAGAAATGATVTGPKAPTWCIRD